MTFHSSGGIERENLQREIPREEVGDFKWSAPLLSGRQRDTERVCLKIFLVD